MHKHSHLEVCMADKQDFRTEMLALKMPWRKKDLASITFQLWQLSDYHGCNISIVLYDYIFQPERHIPDSFILYVKVRNKKPLPLVSFPGCHVLRHQLGYEHEAPVKNPSKAKRHLSFVSVKGAKLSSIDIPPQSWNYPTTKILFSHSLEAF